MSVKNTTKKKMNNNGNKFMDGLVLGAVLGGAAVFFLGTRTGKNLLKIVSEQGLDGFVNLLEEYEIGDWEDEKEFEKAPEADGETKAQDQVSEEEAKEDAPKRRFFKRVRR